MVLTCVYTCDVHTDIILYNVSSNKYGLHDIYMTYMFMCGTVHYDMFISNNSQKKQFSTLIIFLHFTILRLPCIWHVLREIHRVHVPGAYCTYW